MKEIPLTQGQVAFVDEEDYERVFALSWYAVYTKHSFYARRAVPRNESGNQLHLPMPNFILNLPVGQKVDHIDGNGLNNTRSNLRSATTQQNGRNRRKQAGRSSRYKGVCWHLRDKGWQASIRYNSKNKGYLGLFESEIAAAKAYDAAAVKYFSEFARLNFPIEPA